MAALIRRGLGEEGLTVDVAESGEKALGLTRASTYDAIVLDVMLPGIDGFETCRSLRAEGVWTPVLILTARGALDDRVAGLDGGADDYLTKPFSFVELLARLRALVRRGRDRAPIGDRGRRPSARSGGPSGLARRGGDLPLGQGVLPARGIHAQTRPCPHSLAAPRPGLGVRLRAPVQRDRRLHPLSAAARSTCRSGSSRWRRCEAPGTACGRTAEPEPPLDPAAGHARLRRGHGGRAWRR